MKVVEIRNLYIGYQIKGIQHSENVPLDAKIVSMYVMKQLLRLVLFRELKDKIKDVELWIPENLVRSVSRANVFSGGHKSQNNHRPRGKGGGKP